MTRHAIDWPRQSRGDEGVALLVALLFILLLSAIVVEYAYETQVDAALSANHRDDLQAYLAAKSAVASGLGLLAADLIADDVTGQAKNAVNQINALKSGDKTTTGATTGAATGAATGQQSYDSLQDMWAQGIPYQPMNDAVMQCTIDDEYGKINLNALMINGNQVNPVLEQALHALFLQLGVEDDPTNAILDWVDQDDTPRDNGAESDTYSGLETPYAAKNAPMDSIEELLLIRGITPELYFNALANVQTDQTDKFGDKSKDQTANPRPVSLADLLTVHGHPQGKVNVNTARPEVLEALLSATQGTNVAAIDTILQTRLEEPFTSVQDFHSRVGITATTRTTSTTTTTKPANTPVQNPLAALMQQGAAGAMTDPFEVRSDVFRIHGDGRANDIMVRIEAYVFRVPQDLRTGQVLGLGQSRTTTTTKPTATTSKNTQNAGNAQMESFRILDWRVIR